MCNQEDGDFVMEGWLNGDDVHREHDDDLGDGIWFDGYYAADASDYEEAEMEYWNTH